MMRNTSSLLFLGVTAFGFLAAIASGKSDAAIAVKQPVDAIAEAYVKLVLAMGPHDKDYVDAFYGPAKWKIAGPDWRPRSPDPSGD